jgi:hypothetical protein
MVRQVALLIGLAMIWPGVLAAQEPTNADQAVRVGDRWTFETKDEITGETKDTVTEVVTEVSDKEFVTRISARGKAGGRLVAYDHEWNRVDDSLWKYKPNDGRGVRLPITVGKEWRAENESNNMKTGTVVRTTTRTKVAGKETITTPAGTFDTFRIETQATTHMTEDPTKGSDSEVVAWYAPQINHWVKRTVVVRIEKRVRSNYSEELVDFGRKL